MMHAYDKMYLEKGRNALGRMLDFAVYQMKYDIDKYFELFISSGMADRFGRGDASVLVGRSGIELTYEVLYECKGEVQRVYVDYATNRSPEYWAGWALAYYQWYSGISYADITRIVSVSKIVAMYTAYHEMDIRHFVEKMEELRKLESGTTSLKARRIQAGMSQSQLADGAEVSVRTIQQYEQRQKDISKASVSTLAKLAKILYCDIVDLIDKIE